ncbi:hypothetical protein ACHAWX_003574 [Stephanocyclus meneghinianus]
MSQDRSMNPDTKRDYPKYAPNKSRKMPKTVTPRNSPIPKKRVHFSATSTLILLRPRSDRDFRATWYSKRDMQTFRRDVQMDARALVGSRSSDVLRHVAHSIASGAPPSDVALYGGEWVCGLEHVMSREVLRVLIRRRKMTVARVLDEQDEQWRSGKYDPGRIALTSMEYSNFCKDWGRRIARLHWLSERECIDFDRKPCINSK